MRLSVSLDLSSLRNETVRGLSLEVLVDDAVLVQRSTLFLKYLAQRLFVAR